MIFAGETFSLVQESLRLFDSLNVVPFWFGGSLLFPLHAFTFGV